LKFTENRKFSQNSEKNLDFLVGLSRGLIKLFISKTRKNYVMHEISATNFSGKIAVFFLDFYSERPHTGHLNTG
jgi:hypothetical protein